MNRGHGWKRAISALLCGVLLLGGSTAGASSFPDVPDSADYAEAVEALYEQGIITGDENGKFNPGHTITRAESAAIICRLMGVEVSGPERTSFSDVPSSHWASGYIAAAEESGVINGYGNGKFGPGDPVTYAQMVKMLVCVCGYEDIALMLGGYPSGYLSVGKEIGIETEEFHQAEERASRSTVAVLAYRSLDHGEMKVSLDQFEIWQEEGSGCGPYTYEISVDNFGNEYQSRYAGPGDTYNVYKLDAKYHTLSGVFCMKEEFNSTDRISRLYIYGDDNLLATYEITGGEAPIAFTVDVSTVTLLKIRPSSATDFDGAEMSFAADLYLWR